MSVQSLHRAFDIVELLAGSDDGLGLSEIARGLALPTSTVFRLIATLRDRGYVDRDTRSGVYRLGLAFVDMSSLYLGRLELKTEAEPVLRDLSLRTGQTVFLAIRDGRQVVYIDKIEQFNSLRKYSTIGRRMPVYCTSLGKATLLGLADEEIAELLGDVEFARSGPRTHSDLKALMEDIVTSRSRGWTYDDEEAEPGVRCVAAPVYDYRSQIIAAASLSWPIASFPDLDVEVTAEQVKRAAAEISRHMGSRPDAAPTVR